MRGNNPYGTAANNIGRDKYTIALGLNNGVVHRCTQLMLFGSIQWAYPISLEDFEEFLVSQKVVGFPKHNCNKC